MAEFLEASEWVGVGGGGVITRRDALDDDNPQSWPSLWRAKFGEEMPNNKRTELGLPTIKCRCSKCGHIEYDHTD